MQLIIDFKEKYKNEKSKKKNLKTLLKKERQKRQNDKEYYEAVIFGLKNKLNNGLNSEIMKENEKLKTQMDECKTKMNEFKTQMDELENEFAVSKKQKQNTEIYYIDKLMDMLNNERIELLKNNNSEPFEDNMNIEDDVNSENVVNDVVDISDDDSDEDDDDISENMEIIEDDENIYDEIIEVKDIDEWGRDKDDICYDLRPKETRNQRRARRKREKHNSFYETNDIYNNVTTW